MITTTPDEFFEKVADSDLDPLERIRASASLRVILKALGHDLVVQARREGATWREIGEALEISPQAAQQRFS